MFLCSCSVGSANSSIGRVSDCSSEGRQFEPGLVDIKTSLTQLVECQPQELKVVGSIPTRSTLCFKLNFSTLNFSLSLQISFVKQWEF